MDKKQKYMDTLAARYDELNAKIDILKGHARKTEAEARIRLLQEINDLRAKQAVLKEELAKLKKATGEAWEDIRQGADKVWKDLEEAVKSATSHFR